MSNHRPLHLRDDVWLTSLTTAHAAATFRWVCDPMISANLGLRSEPSLAKTLAWIERAHTDPHIRAYAIHSANEHVGNVVLDRIDEYLSSARVHIYIGENRGRGIGRTALFLAVQQAFDHIGLHKVWATVHCNNVASVTAFVNAGFRLEGVLRDEFRFADAWVSVFYFGLLQDEFKEISSIVLRANPL